jgi:WD40 repeat protein
MASAYDGGKIQLWDAKKRTTLGPTLQSNERYFSKVTFSPDGKFVISASNLIQCWAVQSGTPVDPGNFPMILNLTTFSENGCIETIGGQKLWWVPKERSGSTHRGVAMTGDGRLVTFSSAGELTLVDGAELMGRRRDQI